MGLLEPVIIYVPVFSATLLANISATKNKRKKVETLSTYYWQNYCGGDSFS